MVKGLTILAIVTVVFCVGCNGQFGNMNWFGAGKDVPDPQAPVKIVQQFCKDNPAAATSVDLTLLVRDHRSLSVPADLQGQIVTAVQSGTQPLKSGQDVANVRAISHMPLARITLNGPSYALVIYLDSFGLALGNRGLNRFTNTALAEALHRCFMDQGLLRGPMGKSLELALKKASGQVNLYEPLPPATDVEEQQQ